MIDRLMLFGLTRQEAAIYVCLCENGTMNGYEVAKLTGISRSNVYNALAGLVEKGAANRMEASSNKYCPIAVDEMCENKMRQMSEAKTYLNEHLKKPNEAADGYITIEGYSHIRDKVFAMMQQTEYRVYMSLESNLLDEFEVDLKRLIDEKKKVVLLTDSDYELEGAQVYRRTSGEGQIQLIVDSCYVLTGDFTKSAADNCLYSGQKNFVEVFKKALRNEIKLIELGVE